MKHTMTERQLKLLSDVQQVVLDAKANQDETFVLVQVLMANVLLGVMRDRVVSEPEILKATMHGIKSAMEMFRRVKKIEDERAANVA